MIDKFSHEPTMFSKAVRPFYRLVHKLSNKFGWKRLSAWSYLKIYRSYPAYAYWQFAADYLDIELREFTKPDYGEIMVRLEGFCDGMEQSQDGEKTAK